MATDLENELATELYQLLSIQTFRNSVTNWYLRGVPSCCHRISCRSAIGMSSIKWIKSFHRKWWYVYTAGGLNMISADPVGIFLRPIVTAMSIYNSILVDSRLIAAQNLIVNDWIIIYSIATHSDSFGYGQKHVDGYGHTPHCI